MPALSSMIPSRFAQECATEGFVSECASLLGTLTDAPNITAAASVLGGALGGPAAFVAIYAGGAFLQWKREQGKEKQAKARFRELRTTLGRIEEMLSTQHDMNAIERELDERFVEDASLRERFGGAHAETNATAAQEIERVVRTVFVELAIERSFDGVRIYLSNISDWVVETRDNTRELIAGQQETHATLADIQRRLAELDSKEKSSGEAGYVLTEADQRLLDEARAHGDAKAKARAALLERDFAAADEHIEVVVSRAAAELFDAMTLKGDRHYYADAFDDAVEPYEKALDLRPDDITARHNTALAHTRARLGSIHQHQQRAIEIHRGTLDRVPVRSRRWAQTQNNLGLAYRNLPTVDRASNLSKAIDAYQSALEVYTREAHPVEWGHVQNNLGIAYRNLPTVDRASNLSKAIDAYQSALEVYTREAHPVEWGRTQNNLGAAYWQLPTGERATNLSKAIDAYQSALEVYTRAAHPVEWAMTQNNLGVAYQDLPTGDRASNLSKAIDAYELALEVRTREAHPVEWARTQNNLGSAYRNLPAGERATNLSKAIDAYESVLEVYTRAAHPVDWAMTQSNLGVALADLAGEPGQDRCTLLCRAIASSKGALVVRTQEAFPHKHADTTHNLAIDRKAYEAAGCSPPYDEIPPAE